MNYTLKKKYEIEKQDKFGGWEEFMYTLAEIDAIRFYEGDTRSRDINGNLNNMKSTDEFWGDQKAYRTLNALLFPGLDNEKERIKEEGNKLNPKIVDNIEISIGIYCNIYAAMLKSALKNESVITKRVERLQSINNLKEGETVSYTSTSKVEYVGEFADKNGNVFLEFHIPKNFPYIDLEKVLKEEYEHKDEKEVLLPPFTTIAINDGTLLHFEKRIKDINREEPKAKYIINVLADEVTNIQNNSDKEVLRQIVLDKEKCRMASNVILCMNKGEWDIDFSDYIDWKNCLQQYIKLLFIEMRKKII